MVNSFYEQNPNKVLNISSLPDHIRNSIIEEIKYSDIKPKYSGLFPQKRTFYLTENKTAIELNPAFGRVLEWDLIPFPKMEDFHEALNLANKYKRNLPFQSELFSLADGSKPEGFQIIGGEEGIFKYLFYNKPSRYSCLEDYSGCSGIYVNLEDSTCDEGCLWQKDYLVLVKEHKVDL